MRPTFLACVLATGLLLGAGLALADGPSPEHGAKGRERAEAARAAHANHTHNGTDDNDTDDNRTGPRGRGNATRAEDGRPAAVSAYLARLKAIRASWLENATEIREECHAKAAGENATREDRLAVAHCIRDGYKDLRQRVRAELEDARADFRAAMAAARSG